MRPISATHGRVLCLVPLAVLAMAAVPMIDDRYAAVVKSSYTLEDGSTVKLEGVCRFDDKLISCWNGDGVSDPALAERVSAYYLVSPTNLLDFKFNRKNRLAVFTHSNPNIGVNVSTPTSGGLGVATSPNSGLFWSEIDTPEDQKTMNLVLSPNGIDAGPTVQAAFHENSVLRYADATFKLGGSKPEPAGETDEPSPPGAFWMQHLGPGKHWLYYVSIQRTAQDQLTLEYALYDHNGHRIRYVDRDGRVVSDLKRVEESPNAPNQFFSPPWDFRPDPKYPWAEIYEKREVGSVAVLVSNVDPGQVGFLGVSGRRRFSVLFQDIPLDPK